MTSPLPAEQRSFFSSLAIFVSLTCFLFMAIGGAAAIIVGTSAEHSASGASAPIAVDLSSSRSAPP